MPGSYNGGVCLRTEVFGVKLIPGEYRFCFFYYHGLMVAVPVFSDSVLGLYSQRFQVDVHVHVVYIL